jgi:signal peptidase
MKKIVEYVGLIVAVVIMLAAVLTYVAPHFGWRVDSVLTGSMEPAIHVGSLVVTCPTSANAVRVGDIITFKQLTIDSELVSHRVVSISNNSPIFFETKGDANSQSDPLKVSAGDLIGKIVLHIPKLGLFIEFLKTKNGFLFGIVVPGLIVTFLYFINVLRALRERKQTG